MKRAEINRLRASALTLAVLGALHAAHAQERAAGSFEPLLPYGGLNRSNSNLPERGQNSLAPNAAAPRLRDDEAMLLEVERTTAPADGKSALRLKLTLLDKDGAKLRHAALVHIETSLGSLAAPGAVDAERLPKFLIDRDRREPGMQVVVTDGELEFTLTAPVEPGDASLRVASGNVTVTARLAFVPDLRPLLAVGLVEGIVRLAKEKRDGLSPARPNDGLEQELRVFSRRNDPDAGRSTTFGGRAALFAKGALDDDYLLTFSYDSDKPTRGRLFRDIQPEQFYPIYGDASTKGFDAQSAQPLYLRVDKDKSHFVAGDIATDVNPSEARNLGRYSRSLTGVRQHYENERVVVNAFGARDNAKQIIDEQPGRGVSGPYSVSNTHGIGNSEKIEIVTRDRNQPAVVLKSQPLLRFDDYEFEPFSGRILFRKPIASVDENLNPVSIRITYEVEQGGPKFWVGGIDGQFKLGEQIEFGGGYVRDANPIAPYELGSANATIKLGERSFLVGELARSRKSDLLTIATPAQGNAQRVELRHESGDLAARLFAGHTDADFDNPAATLSKGRSEAGAKASYKLADPTQLNFEALRTQDVGTGAERAGASLSLAHQLNETLRLEGGLRYARDTVNTAATPAPGTTASCDTNAMYTPGLAPSGGLLACPLGNGPLGGNDVRSARLRLTAKIDEAAAVYAEAEQDLQDRDKHAAALGGEYRVFDKGRVYARHEYSRSLSGLYGLNGGEATHATLLGLDTAYMKDGQVFSEYRLRDAAAGRDAEAAMGLKNLWRLSDGLAVSTNFERVHTLAGSSHAATAAGAGLEYTQSALSRFSGRLEGRRDASADTYLSTLAHTYKLDDDWSLLAKNLYLLTDNHDVALGEKTQNRAIVGLAYRQTALNQWNALARYENKFEDDSALVGPARRGAHIASTHVNYKPQRDLVLAGQVAGKWVHETFTGAPSRFAAQLVAARLMVDVTERWDMGLQGGLLRGQGAKQYGVGVEGGYRAVDNLWLSAGFNFTGFSDRDLADSDYTKKGFYLRLRFKFDEKLLDAASRWGTD
jgi:hypothetical protein